MHRPDGKADWLELLVQGLVFDCHGLAPGEGAAIPEQGALLGLTRAPSAAEAIELSPGPHLAAAGAMLPVVRTLMALALRLAELPGLVAISWHPAGSWMEPDYFRKIAGDWIAGGAFPVLGLTVLEQRGQGIIGTVGLGFLIGQEIVFDLGADADRTLVARIAIRLVHELVTHGRLVEPRELVGAWSEELWAAPEQGGSIVRVTLRQ